MRIASISLGCCEIRLSSYWKIEKSMNHLYKTALLWLILKKLNYSSFLLPFIHLLCTGVKDKRHSLCPQRILSSLGNSSITIFLFKINFSSCTLEPIHFCPLWDPTSWLKKKTGRPKVIQLHHLPALRWSAIKLNRHAKPQCPHL